MQSLIARFLEIALIVAGVVIIWEPDGETLRYMLSWNLIAVIYIAVVTVSFYRYPEVEIVKVSPKEWFVSGIALISALVGISATLAAILTKHDQTLPPTYKAFYTGVAGVTMVVSWVIMQLGFARLYEHAYRNFGGLRFPGTEKPVSVDFAYFAFTVGSSFATSDVNVTTSRMRSRVLGHSAWSFFYNAAIIAMAFGLIQNAAGN